MQRPIPVDDNGLEIRLRPNIGSRHPSANSVRLSRSRLARSVAWAVAGSAFAQGGSFLTSVALAHVLGKNSFGQFALIQSTVTAFTTLASLGLGLTATKFISEYRACQPERIGKLLGLSSLLVLLAGFCFAIALALFSPALAVRSDQASITTGLRLSTICVFFLTLTGYQVGVLAGFEAFRTIGRIGIACGLANPLLSWWAGARLGLTGAVWAQSAGAVLLWSLYEIAVRSECRRGGVTVQYRDIWDQRSILTRVSIPATACGMAATLAIWGSNALLVEARGFGELAIFTAAYNLRSVVMFLPALILRVAAPRLNYLLAAGNFSIYSHAFWKTVAVNSGLALLGAILAFHAGQPFLRLFGTGFAGSEVLPALILCSAVVEVIANTLYLALFAETRFWRNLAVMSLWMAGLLLASAVASPRYGATGLASANLAAWSLSVGIYAVQARRQIGDRERA